MRFSTLLRKQSKVMAWRLQLRRGNRPEVVIARVANPLRKSTGHDIGEWEYDHDQRMQRYWDGTIWVYYDAAEKKEKFWDGTAWQWKA